MRIEPELKLDFHNVLIRPKRSTLKSRQEVSLERTFTFRHTQKQWTGVPILSSNMDTTGTMEMAKVFAEYKMITVLHKYYSKDEVVRFLEENPAVTPYVAISAGSAEGDLERLRGIMAESKVEMVCLDVANGYTESFVTCVKKVRDMFPEKIIMAGNVVTADMTESLILAGADIIKVGIGGGSACTTRKQTGCGYPQLSAVMECADAAHGLKAHIISDGGCVVPGDIAKAMGGGADFVMLGGMLAGHEESGGVVVERENKKYKEFYGMSSQRAMEKYCGEVAEYRSSEGKKVILPYRGAVRETIKDFLGGLRSACTYVGAMALRELPKRTTFVRVSMQLNQVFSE
jgi:GMP reductase